MYHCLPMTQEALLEHIKQNPFICAPMAAITDSPFRSFIRGLGSSVVVSELISAKGIEYANVKTRKMMDFREDQRPVGIQLFGEDADSLAKGCQVVEELGADFVDLNLGCPVSKVVKKGAGSALLKDLKSLEGILRAMVSATRLPVTIKIRTGWDSETRNALQVARLAADCGITWVAIHGRTRAQGYEGEADWNYMAEVKSQAPLPIIGNGDLTTASLAVDRLLDSGVDAVMIGRGALKNPWIFADSLALYQSKTLEGGVVLGNPSPDRDPTEPIRLLFHHYTNHESDERVLGLQLKKFASWFSSGFPRSAQFRKRLFSLQDPKDIESEVRAYFQELKGLQQEDTSEERFLMGGHG